MNVSTVYRTLELLVGLDLVQEYWLGGRRRRRSARSPAGLSPPTSVCEECGAVGHLDDGPLEPVRRELLGTQGFLVSEVRMTVFGLCADCRAPAEPSADGRGEGRGSGTQARIRGVRRVHIPDGYLGPETIVAGWAITAPVGIARTEYQEVAVAAQDGAGAGLRRRFSFLVMMLNVPVAGGTTAHAVGAVLIAVIAGPEVACLAVSAALVIQAFFGDGGILTLGVNCLTMAIVMPYTGYGVSACWPVAATCARRGACTRPASPRGAAWWQPPR